jgi:hypothetical protein
MRRRTRPKYRPTGEPLSIELRSSELAEYIGAHEVAQLLGVSISHVYALGRSGSLTRLLIRAALLPITRTESARPHPWLLAEQRRLAQLSGWRSVPSLKHRLTRKSLPKPLRSARLRFRRDDVLAFKLEREQRQRCTSAHAHCREIFGHQAIVQLRMPKLSRLPRLLRQEPQQPAPLPTVTATSTARLLAFPTPSQLARGSKYDDEQ